MGTQIFGVPKTDPDIWVPPPKKHPTLTSCNPPAFIKALKAFENQGLERDDSDTESLEAMLVS